MLILLIFLIMLILFLMMFIFFEKFFKFIIMMEIMMMLMYYMICMKMNINIINFSLIFISMMIMESSLAIIMFMEFHIIKKIFYFNIENLY